MYFDFHKKLYSVVKFEDKSKIEIQNNISLVEKIDEQSMEIIAIF